MLVSRRTGKRYAAGSHTTLGAYPRLCAAGEACLHGRKVSVSAKDGPPLWFETPQPYGGELLSWHVDCRPRAAG